MADDNAPNPLDALISSTLGSTPDPGQPDVSSLPVNSGSAPQAPTPSQPVQGQAPPPSGYQGPRPILMDLVQGLIKPRTVPGMIDRTGAQAPDRPVSRAATFEEFLGNFVGALSQGFSASDHGPGAAARGAGAAIGAPLAMQQQQQQFQSEQAQRQAQTQMTQEQAAALPAQRAAQLAALSAQPRFDPDTKAYLGQMNDAQFQNYLKGQGAASTTARSKEAIAELNSLASQGKVAFIKPAAGGGFAAYDKQGNLMRVLEGAIDTGQLQKVSTTQQFLPDGAGGFIVQPKTTVSGVAGPAQQLQQKVPALAAPQAQPPASGFPKGGGAAPAQPGGHTIYTKEPIFAFDPTTQERVLTTPAEAAQNGWTNPVKVKEGDIDKYRTATVQFNDVQSNLSRYTKAARDYSNPRAPLTRNGVAVSPQNPVEVSGMGSFVGMPSQITNSDDMRARDNDNLHTLLNKAGWADMQASISAGGHITVPMLTAMGEKLSRSVNSKAYNELSDQGKALMDGYIRTLSSVPAYQKALTSVGKLNKEAMELEMANIPNPTMAPNDQLRKLQAFQENIDQGATGIPRLPGVPTVRETRAKFEGTGQGAIQLPRPF